MGNDRVGDNNLAVYFLIIFTKERVKLGCNQKISSQQRLENIGKMKQKRLYKERLVGPGRTRAKYRDFSVIEKRLVLSLST